MIVAHEAIPKENFRRGTGVLSHFFLGSSDGNPLRVGRNGQDHRRGGRLSEIFIGGDDMQAGPRSVRNVNLAAVQKVAAVDLLRVTVDFRPANQNRVFQIGPRGRFGDRGGKQKRRGPAFMPTNGTDDSAKNLVVKSQGNQSQADVMGPDDIGDP